MNPNTSYNSTPSPTDGGRWGYQQGLPSPDNNTNTSRELVAPGPAPNTNQTPGVPGAFPIDTPPGPSRKPSGSRICGKCGENLTGQFVRALGDTFHLECFTCHDCDKIVASKFFPVPDQPPGQYPLCETDYFRRLDLLCFQCGGALRGSYITALDRKYHIEHFTCSVCPTVFGAQDSYYEHEGNVYCHYHYSTKFAQRCNGCQNSILKQFVEIYRNGQNQHWHPECYMIHKYWNVRLFAGEKPLDQPMSEADATDEVRHAVRKDEERVEEKVLWIWRTLSTFEEKSATCISDMLLHVSNGAYVEGVLAAKKFIIHVELLFGAADDLDRLLTAKTPKSLSYSREAKLLCKKVVAFFQLLSESHVSGMRRLGVTQELLSLVTGLAHYLKLLIRICLQGALKLERETGSTEGLQRFLDRINSLDQRLEDEDQTDQVNASMLLIHRSADTCPICEKPVEDKCVRAGERVFHYHCMVCQNCGIQLEQSPSTIRWSPSSQKLLCNDCAVQFPDARGGVFEVTRLQQYIHLLKVAHARLMANLQNNGTLPHTSDDPNLRDYDSTQGHQLTPQGEVAEPPLLRSDTRSRSYGGSPTTDPQGQSSYEQTLGDIRRLRSTRLDKHLSQTMQRARSSRIIDRPEGGNAEPGSEDTQATTNLQIVHDRDMKNEEFNSLTFGANSLALDDIPRIVAAEQAKDQRPNASKYARGHLIGSEPKPRLVNGHRREYSGDRDADKLADGGMPRGRKFFSELSALEYFNVRHIAVLQMAPLLEGQFNQEELLELIETKRPSIWDKFGRAFKPDKSKGGNKRAKSIGYFGRPLEDVVNQDGAESTDGVGPGTLRVPQLVQDCISAMRNMDMSVEGVFRKNGNIRRLNESTEKINNNGCDAVDLTQDNPVQVAALLKKFLRELPDPVMTFKLQKLFIAGARANDDEKRRRILHLTCCLLPKVHRDTMEVLFEFLKWAASFHTVDEESGSKMDVHNLATVMAPNLLYSSSARPDTDASFLAIEAVSTMIECNSELCQVPEDLQMMLGDSSLFSGSAELTTKEILKRYHDHARAPTATAGGVSPNTPAQSFSRGSRSSAPQVQRIETDPSLWQTESSVRHVGGPGAGMTYGPSNGSNQHTPTSQHHPYDLPGPAAPYAQQGGSQESVNGSPNRSSMRASGLPKQGPMGVTGAV
ncbi:RhoGAP-domain-containing protein [Rhizodiscina lignyota]|uniref:RhoGAP-domain-containing protein n=1 Tax=Rhizodiscina lignyota TaxID=1504668 RepID=A0A9P4M9L1_9PEZI|nr:RhoGAP-domain-containing protein [Rhizodiscina lignyota]